MALNTSFDSRSVFRKYVERNVAYALSLLADCSPLGLSREKQTIALQGLQFALSSAEFWPISRRLLLALAPQMELLDLRVLWRPYLEDGLRQSISVGDRESEMVMRYYLGNLQREMTDYDGAVQQYEAGIALAQSLQDKLQEARFLNRLAFALRRKRKLDEAEQLALRALSFSQDDLLEQGYSYLVLGSILYDRRLWEQCLDYSHRVIACWETGAHKRDLAWGYMNLGVTLWRVGSLDKARQYLEKAITHFDIIGDVVHQASARMNLGIVLVELGSVDDALRSLKESERVFRAVQDELRMALVANNLAHVYEVLHRWDDAVDAYKQSFGRWKTLGNNTEALNVIHSLVKLNIDLNRSVDAQNFLQEAQLLLTSMKENTDYDRLAADYKELVRRLAS